MVAFFEPVFFLYVLSKIKWLLLLKQIFQWSLFTLSKEDRKSKHVSITILCQCVPSLFIRH